ncbi:MAG: GNAT family N-acetyltransferase [Lachnospiraceae bacterium]|nr:GNAT family N-acetyltransferase [Lachnospiraceae bacterium]
MKIDGKNIYLSSITYNDTDDIINWRNKDFVRDCFIYREIFTKEIHNNWMRTMVETGKVMQFIIYTMLDNRKIGSVYIRDIDKRNKECEFGIFIGEEEYIGKGYGHEATDLLCEYTFSKLGINRIFLRVLADNERAIKTYKKSGFIEDKKNDVVIIDDEPVEVIFMSNII